ncbi:MAG: glycoside hydrolase family 3 C-terminal domain-containing protein [Clostridiaceae bacterium]|nr:glycoside hydrolase family 3 C-terminal domain-containing protein [Clostridiaceae bacterium]
MQQNENKPQDPMEFSRALVAQMTLAEKMAQMVYNAPAIERLGIPAYNWWNECLHGAARSGTATVFPQAIGMAASFNTGLMQRAAAAISDEVRAKYNEYKKFGSTQIYQGLTCWSPNINIFRDPRWGRGHETYGEDPYLTGRMGVAFVRGLQGDDPNFRKVDATLKHYAVHSGPEAERHGFNVQIGAKDLNETYLAAFRTCIREARPAAVMGAYNRVNGEACCASPILLRQILREQFGFQGYVVSDCGAICDINRFHKITNDEAESAALAVRSGCDLNCGSAYTYLKAAFVRGLVDEAAITTAVERLFAARYALGMFGPANPYDEIPYEIIDCPEHQALALRMARESIVLLKNDGILPLADSVGSLAVIGPNNDERSILLGNYNGLPSHFITLFEGISAGAPQGTRIYKAAGCDLIREPKGDWAEQPLHEALIAADKSDVVILCLGLRPDIEGEEGDAYNSDMSGDRRDIDLPAPQLQLFDEVYKRGKPVVVVNCSGSAVNLAPLHERAAAVLQVWYPGQSGGTALADILFGRMNPSGKLPVTFYQSTADLPDFRDYAMKGRTYRYMEQEPLYPFGFGLSYSRFALSELQLAAETIQDGDDLTLRVKLTNLGPLPGQETVQVYLRHLDCPVETPRLQLAAFTKETLAAGETRWVELTVRAEQFRIYDQDGQNIFYPGPAELWAACNQPSARSRALGAPEELRCRIKLAAGRR